MVSVLIWKGRCTLLLIMRHINVCMVLKCERVMRTKVLWSSVFVVLCGEDKESCVQWHCSWRFTIQLDRMKTLPEVDFNHLGILKRFPSATFAKIMRRWTIAELNRSSTAKLGNSTIMGSALSRSARNASRLSRIPPGFWFPNSQHNVQNPSPILVAKQQQSLEVRALPGVSKDTPSESSLDPPTQAIQTKDAGKAKYDSIDEELGYSMERRINGAWFLWWPFFWFWEGFESYLLALATMTSVKLLLGEIVSGNTVETASQEFFERHICRISRVPINSTRWFEGSEWILSVCSVYERRIYDQLTYYLPVSL